MPPLLVRRRELEEAQAARMAGTWRSWTHALPSTLYKFVDPEHAHFLESGSVKIGNSVTYQNLENGRADKIDGTVLVYPENVHIKRGVRNAARRGLEQFGIYGDGEIKITGSPGGIMFQVAQMAAGVLCFATTPDAPSLNLTEQAVFRIDNVEAFVLRLMKNVNVEYMGACAVKYGGTVHKDFDNVPDVGMFCFTKDKVRESDNYSFEGECEYRFVFPEIAPEFVGNGLPGDFVLKHLMTRIQ